MDITDIVRTHAEAVEGKLTDNTKSIATLREQVAQLEQKAVSGRGMGSEPVDSWGEQFVRAEGLKGFAQETSRPSRFRFDVKATLTSDAASAGALAPAARDFPALQPMRRVEVRDLLTIVPTSNGSVEYASQTTRTNNAGMVAEGAQKPESAYAYEMKNVPIRTIAHWVPASRQIMDDAGLLSALIDTELRYGLALKAEEQILTGDGTGQNLTGLVPSATAYSPPATLPAAATAVDTLGAALLQVTLANYQPDGIVLHPSDWFGIGLLKDTTGSYLMLNPQEMLTPRLFGLPVALTPAIAAGTFLVGQFKAQTLYDRWQPRVEISTEHADFFTRNLVAVLAEERIGLAVRAPGALVTGSFEEE